MTDDDVQSDVTQSDHDEAELDEGLGAPSLHAALEALLLVADQPVPAVQLAALTRTPQDEVLAALHDLSQEYAVSGRGFDLRELGGGWRFWTRDSCSGVVSRYVLDGQDARLSQAALETLAVIAYRQPVTRALLLRTTPYFLERMGLAALQDLPPIAEHLPMPDSVEEVLDLV